MFWECYELLDGKHYMSCILAVAQTYEMFFATFLRAQLLYKPFVLEDCCYPEIFNASLGKLHAKTMKLTFDDLRNLVLYAVISEITPTDMKAAQAAIDALPLDPKTPKDTAVNSLRDTDLRANMLRLKGVKVNEIRNRIIHKDAYRPRRDEAVNAHIEAGKVLFWLKEHFNISDDLTWYQVTLQP